MKLVRWIAVGTLLLVAGGCATIPPGPSVLVMPGGGKSFEVFQADDASCRGWAQVQSGWNANETVNQNLAAGAVGGGALGAAAGALIGAASGATGPGAAIGAGVGLLAGTAMAAPVAQGRAGRCSGATTTPTSSACTPRATRSRRPVPARRRDRPVTCLPAAAGLWLRPPTAAARRRLPPQPARWY